ncbi:MAG: hypothetical protein QNJ54_28375, partial [Prochloraceae cyanobacterium]|nr:hypothetical protein [Prochloraceae cyanobacterium]
MKPEKFIEVNQILGEQPRLGIFTSAQIFTSVTIVMIVYLIVFGVLNLSMPAFIVVSIWLVSSWLLLVGDSPYKFLDLFQNPPGTDWCNGHLKYHSPLKFDDQFIPPIIATSQEGKKLKFMPFQNYLHLNFIFTIHTPQELISGYLLKFGSKYQIVWAFKSVGFHYMFDEIEASNKANAIC